MVDQLEQIRKLTTIVCDTGDIDSIKKHRPTDATTNPSLIFAAAQKEQYHHLIEEAVSYAKSHSQNKEGFRSLLIDKVFVNFGSSILEIIPGRVSTEVDARLSFDVEKSIEKAKTLISLYEDKGISRERILIKLATTWEGILAAEQLEKEGIHCNMTLLFCLIQAVACADVGATLISPFVGRILDWYKKNTEQKEFLPHEDPGVKSVTQIYNYYKKFGYKTQIMGASFRNKDQIVELAGSDLLTISPQLLEELASTEEPVAHKLNAELSKTQNIEKIDFTESSFRYMLNDDAMATEKLSEGIRRFVQDSIKLEKLIFSKFV